MDLEPHGLASLRNNEAPSLHTHSAYFSKCCVKLVNFRKFLFSHLACFLIIRKFVHHSKFPAIWYHAAAIM